VGTGEGQEGRPGTNPIPTRAPTSTRGPTSDEGPTRLSPREINLIIFGLLLGIFLSAVDGTIVSTALPTIVGDLGGLDQLTWVVTSYFVTSTVATLVFGRVSDLYGRRPVFLFSIGAFLVASALAGLSRSMAELVAFRALQGIGGGAMQTLAFIVLGDILSPRERGRYMGWFTGTFALSGLVGPLLGGLIVDSGALGWRWIFYFNLPVGVITLVVVGRYLRLPHPRAEVRLDWFGALLLAIGVGALLVAASIGGGDLPWSSPVIVALLVGGSLFSIGFVIQELRAEAPILPLRLFGNDVFAVGMALAFLVGAAVMSANIFLPLFLQVVTGASATLSGLLLAPMMLGLTVASIVAGRRITSTGTYRHLIRTGPLVSVVGIVGLSLLGTDSHPWSATPFVIVNGLGMGLMMPGLSIAIQNGVGYRDLGVATSANTFFRTLGMTCGVAVFGALMAARLRTELADRLPPEVAGDLDVAELTGSPETIRQLPDAIRVPVVASVAESVNLVYLAAVPVALAAVVAGWLLRGVPLRERSPMEEAAAEAARSAGPGGGQR
jgi:EmrB/QacA subfamily drug resistance transporter